MSVAYYPSQAVLVGAEELTLIQSASVDFNISRQDVFEFGSVFAVDSVQVQPPTVNLNFSYAIASGTANNTNHTKMDLNALGTLLADMAGKQYTVSGAGNLVLQSGLVSSYAINASVGNIPTATVQVQGISATYTPGSIVNATRNATNITAATPQNMTLVASNGGSNGSVSARSFTATLDVPKQYIYQLGSLTPVGVITNGAAKVTVESEFLMLGSSSLNRFDKDIGTLVLTMPGSVGYTVNNCKLVSYTENAGLNDALVATARWEAIIKTNNDFLIGG
jgi:hypothetical protein